MSDLYPALQGKRVCLITSGPIGSDPRLIKEAQSLHCHGVKVQVVSLNVTQTEHVQRRNAIVLEGVGWACVQVHGGGRVGQVLLALAQKLARLIVRIGIHPLGLVAIAFNKNSRLLCREALRHSADLYIAHNLAALPAALAASQKHGGKAGFDAEDFHSGELPEGQAWDLERGLVQALESHYLPRCDYVTAASPGIARAYASTCGIPEPRTVLNVFPLSQSAGGASKEGQQPPGPSIYWFSQTTGPGRGLEDMVRAIGMARSRPHAYLRGTVAADYREKLELLAQQCNAEGHIHFLPPENPDEMARIAAAYDLGLASESIETPNRRIALTNKIFTYLLAGVPSVASATPAQSELALEVPGAIFLYPPGDPDSLTGLLDSILESTGTMADARASAWAFGQSRFNWEQEQHAFLEEVSKVLDVS